MDDELIEGYRKFRANVWPEQRARYEALANWGQSPETMILACSDSRVDPQTIFGSAPGEMFVLRNVAAIARPISRIRRATTGRARRSNSACACSRCAVWS